MPSKVDLALIYYIQIVNRKLDLIIEAQKITKAADDRELQDLHELLSHSTMSEDPELQALADKLTLSSQALSDALRNVP